MKRLILILLFLVLVAGGAIFWFLLREPKGKVLSSATSAYPLTVSKNNLISFISDRDGSDEVYLTNYEGTFLRRLTFNSQKEFSPIYSPVINSVAYFSKGNDYTAIILFDLDTGEKRLVGITHNKPDFFKFSPEGKFLAFIENYSQAGLSELFIIRLKDGKLERVAINVQDFTWSDDNTIIYTEKSSTESITKTKIFLRSIEEGENLNQAKEIFQGGVAPVYLASLNKILFLDTTGEFFRLMIISLRGENTTDLFNIKIRPQENTHYYMDLNKKENGIILTVYSDSFLIDSILISLKDQNVKTLDLITQKIKWTTDSKIVFTSNNQQGKSQLWLKVSPDAETNMLTKEGNNWF